MMIRTRPIIGLTGAPGSGKSTVAQQFAQLGCAVINADQLNHEVLARPEVIEQLVGWWGSRITDEAGQIARHAVGRIVFDDLDQLKRLTDLVHPLVIEREKQLLETYQRQGQAPAIVLDVPLLFEVGQDRWCDAVVFVSAEEPIRLARVAGQRGWAAAQLKKVENSQIALDTKAKNADYSVYNNSDIPSVRVQVERIFTLLAKH